MTDTGSLPIVLHADQEHDRLKTAVISILIFLLFVIFTVSRVVFSTMLSDEMLGYTFILSCVTALVLGLTLGWFAEQYLKTVWSSGNNVTISPHEIVATNKEAGEVRLNREAGITQFSWYFKLENTDRNGRERRLPKNSICLASEVAQGDGHVVVYAYAPANEAENWTKQFREIDPRELTDEKSNRFAASKTRTIPVELLRGKNGRYWIAERHRWQTGMELTKKDFETFMDKSSE
jgi:hypothetical protein